MSSCSNAVTYRSSSSRSSGAATVPGVAGRWSSIVTRARWSALLTDATLDSSNSATSGEVHPSTSRKIRTARWRPGSSWIARSSASSIPSRIAYRASGSYVGAAASSEGWSGNGSSGSGRRRRRSSSSRHALVAIRYSHV